MFTSPLESTSSRWKTALFISFALHCFVLCLLVRAPRAIYVVPSDTDLGLRGSSGSVSITYLAPVRAEQPKPAPHGPAQPTLLARKTVFPDLKSQTSQLNTPTDSASPQATARGGSPNGRVPGAPLNADEVVPALPEVFPDPSVSRADLPIGVEGDVIVEVTIDADGNVVETKLLHGLGYGIEEKVLAALQRWHFRPAMRDGVTIASQHVVYFHYPS